MKNRYPVYNKDTTVISEFFETRKQAIKYILENSIFAIGDYENKDINREKEG